MTTDIEKLKQKIAPIANKYDLQAVYLFGSRARGDAHLDSDYDFYIEKQKTMGMFELSGLFQELKELFQKEVDIVIKPNSPYTKLDKHIVEAIQKDGVLLYA